MVSATPWSSNLFLEARGKFEYQWGDDKVPTNGRDLSGWFQPPIGLQIGFSKYVKNLTTNGGVTRYRQVVRNCRDGVIRPVVFKFVFEVRVKFEYQWGDDKVPTNGQDFPGWYHPPIGLQVCFLKYVWILETNGGMTRSGQMSRICRDGFSPPLVFKFVS